MMEGGYQVVSEYLWPWYSVFRLPLHFKRSSVRLATQVSVERTSVYKSSIMPFLIRFMALNSSFRPLAGWGVR